MHILFAHLNKHFDFITPHIIQVCAAEAKHTSLNHMSKIKTSLKNDDIDIFVCDTPDYELFELAKSRNMLTLLVTDQTIYQYSIALQNRDHELLDHIIGAIDSRWVIHELRTTLQKIITQDIFGVAFYLRSKTEIKAHTICHIDDRQKHHTEVSSYMDRQKAPSAVVRHCHAITEELLMNALFDAPRAAGVPQHAQPSTLPPDQRPLIEYGFDGKMIAISVKDPHGSFPKDIFFNYLRKSLHRGDSDKILDDKTEGAGIGLFKILSYCHGIICNQNPGLATEVIAIIDCEKIERNIQKIPRSIHYFEQSSSHIT